MGEGIRSAVSYAGTSVPIRGDLEAAHTHVWQRMGAPGTWWTGAERVAIAGEVRRARSCALCRERKRALSPAGSGGDHDHGGALPEPAVEAVHRVATDPARLSRRWVEGLAERGLSDARYVEALGVAVRTIAIDAFCRALGHPLHPLPEPLPGAPSRLRPPGARHREAWVPMTPGPEPQVARALSLVPDEARAVADLLAAHYVPVERVVDLAWDPGRALSRPQMELVAARVSALNECFY